MVLKYTVQYVHTMQYLAVIMVKVNMHQRQLEGSSTIHIRRYEKGDIMAFEAGGNQVMEWRWMTNYIKVWQPSSIYIGVSTVIWVKRKGIGGCMYCRRKVFSSITFCFSIYLSTVFHFHNSFFLLSPSALQLCFKKRRPMITQVNSTS